MDLGRLSINNPQFQIRNPQLRIFISLWLFFNPVWSEASAKVLPSPKDVVAEFCRLDENGFRLSGIPEKETSKLKSLLLFPDRDVHSGKDLFYIIADYRIIYGLTVNSEAVVYVEYSQQWIGSKWKLVDEELSERITFKLQNTEGGWKITGGLSFPRVSFQTAITLYKRKIFEAVDRKDKKKIKLYSEFINRLINENK